MKRPILKVSAGIAIMLFSCLLVLNSCKKNTSDYITPTEKWNNSEMTNATLMGQIIQEDGSPLDGAIVTTGTHQYTTDADGFFYFSKISTPKKATLIKVEKLGYFKAFRTLSVLSNQDNQAKIMVMALPTAVNLNAVAGGNVAISNGGSIDFPANAIVDAVTNAPYTGNVSVFAKWIDPTGAALGLLAPGDFRAINTENEEQTLATYGMQVVELVGSAGQKLQLGNGKSAALKFPIPSSLMGSAPATIPLWHFDEALGIWVEEGSATKVGSEYVGAVSHFSFWNCDVPFLNVNCQLTLVDASNNPISGAWVKLTTTSALVSVASSYGVTNSAGVVSGAIPQSASFTLEYIPAGCPYNSTYTFIQNFTSGTTNVNLGNITVSNTTASVGLVTGTVEDCGSLALANAPVKLKVGTSVFSTMTNASGAFSFSVNCLAAATSATVTAFDPINTVNGTSNITITPGTTTNAGVVAACGTQNDFISIDVTIPPATTPTNYSIIEPAGTFSQSFQGLRTYINGTDNSSPANPLYISFDFDGPQTVAGTHNLMSYNDSNDSTSSFSPTIVNLTNYGAIGGKISGSFTTTVNGPLFYNNAALNCSFRVTRQF